MNFQSAQGKINTRTLMAVKDCARYLAAIALTLSFGNAMSDQIAVPDSSRGLPGTTSLGGYTVLYDEWEIGKSFDKLAQSAIGPGASATLRCEVFWIWSGEKSPKGERCNDPIGCVGIECWDD